MSEEIAAADAALSALHEAQQEVARLLLENDVLRIELEQARAIGRTLLAQVEMAEKQYDHWRMQAQDTLTDPHAQAVELDAACIVVEAVRASVYRETAYLPFEKADMLALGRVLDALQDYDAAVKARQ